MAAYQPHTATGYDGSRFKHWFEYDSGTSGPGTAKGQFWGPGDTGWSSTFTFKDETGTAISVAEGQLGNVALAYANHAPWSLALVVDGETDVSDWFSCDDGATWTRVT